MFTVQEMLVDCSVFRSGEQYKVALKNSLTDSWEVLTATVSDRDDSYVGVMYSDGAVKSMPVEEFNDQILCAADCEVK
tara:strand:+ start:2695 stop:2928 length:234 start_codon:yes stop_codon:yes gene_type:complete